MNSIEQIVGHEIRSHDVFFDIKWRGYDIRTKEIAEFFLVNDFQTELSEYLSATRRMDERKFEILVKKNSVIAELFREPTL